MPAKARSAGRCASVSSPSAICCSPTTALERSVLDDLRFEHVHRRAADEAADEQVHRTVVERLRIVDLLQLALAHHGDTSAHRHGLDLIVGHVDRRDPEIALELRDLGAGLHAQLRVEVGERLVHQERLRLADDRPAHRDALPLTAGERSRLALQQLFETEHVCRPLHPLVDLVLRHSLPQAQPEGDVLEDGEVRVERVALEHHRDVAVARRDVVDDPLADPEDTLRDVLEARHHPERRRLAAPRRPDEDHELAVSDVERDLVHGTCAVRVDLAHTIERHLGHGNPQQSNQGTVLEARSYVDPTRP